MVTRSPMKGLLASTIEYVLICAVCQKQVYKLFVAISRR